MPSRSLFWSFLVFFLVSHVVHVTCRVRVHVKPPKPKPIKPLPVMAKPDMSKTKPADPVIVDDPRTQKFKTKEWRHAHATHYEGDAKSFGGACGYHDVVKEGYGLETVALSNALFNKGEMCGACFEIKCENTPEWCKPGNPSLNVTATNHCPPNYDQPSDNGGWCNEPREHFDVARPVFERIAKYKAGIVPVAYRRIPCYKQGGMKFTITGNPYFTEVLVWNVAGAGDVMNVEMKTDEQPKKWLPMKRMWGQRWVYNGKLCEKQCALSFRVTSGDKLSVISEGVAPKGWKLGQVYEGKNFAV